MKLPNTSRMLYCNSSIYEPHVHIDAFIGFGQERIQLPLVRLVVCKVSVVNNHS